MQHTNWSHSLAIAAALVVALPAATADAQRNRFPIDLQELRAEAEQRFDAADADGDGAVAVEEFLTFMASDAASRQGRLGKRSREGRVGEGAGREGVFDAADSNGDGQLSEQEFDAVPDAARRVRLQRLFARRDGNDDGLLSFAEFPSELARFEALDANADGLVSRDEMPRRRPHRERR